MAAPVLHGTHPEIAKRLRSYKEDLASQVEAKGKQFHGQSHTD